MSIDLDGLEAALSRATPVRDGWKLREKDGQERYDLIGDPCGFPVATFGDHNDAAFDLAARQQLPALIAELRTLRAEKEAMREALASIKLLALSIGAPGQLAVPAGLRRMIRVCIDAGVIEKLDELRACQALTQGARRDG